MVRPGGRSNHELSADLDAVNDERRQEMAKTLSERRESRLRPSFWHASLATPSFHFDAYGVSEEEARVTMVRTAKAHCRQREIGYDALYWEPDSVVEVKTGQGWRDRDQKLVG